MSKAAKKDFDEPSRVRVVSSAYWEILCSLSHITIPLIPWFCLIRTIKISAQRRNRYGATGSPCRHPLWMRNCLDKNPLCNTHALKSVFRIFIQLIIYLPKLKYCKTLYVKSHEMESKAFSKFINNSKPGILCDSV